MAGLLLFRNDLGDGDEDLNCEETHTILVILDKVLEEGYHFVDYDGCGHLLDKLGQVGGGLSADHGGIIVDEQTKLLAELFLDGRRHLAVRSGEEAAARHLGGEPVCFGESDGEGDEVLLDLLC